ncbi:MAG: alpha/beta hydrolase, partial [Myxococcales bacterium]|nr:alpha/beta hydrolase [Myxococcales bacterium]
LSLGGDGPADARRLPGLITAASRGRLSPDLARLASQDVAFCAGYRPTCVGGDWFSMGVFLTDFCSQLPTDRAALDAAVAGRHAFEQVFERSPYEAACRAWDVPPAAEIRLPTGDTRVLLLSGELDSFSRPEWNEIWVSQLGSRAFSVTIPGQTHNVLGFSECALAVRAAWRENPAAPPNSRLCDRS